MSDKPSLALGADMTPETWADFVARLRHDCVGEGVRNHYTADAVFLVQKRVWQTVPEETSDILRVHTDGYDEPLDEFIADLDPEELQALDKEVDGSFSSAYAYEQKEALAKLYPDSTLYHAYEEWETVNQHFTKDAAEAFIKRKAHDYRNGLRVYVGASTYSWELNTIKAAMLDGRLGLTASLADAQAEIARLRDALEEINRTTFDDDANRIAHSALQK